MSVLPGKPDPAAHCSSASNHQLRRKTMRITIPEAVKQMLVIVEQLCAVYPKKKFTLDGRLVGDIGEVLVEDAYDLKLYEDVKKHHDAECSDGRLVQIKATMKK